MARIFSVRLNVDAWTSAFMRCDTDAEKAQLASGFAVGLHGAPAGAWSEAKLAGHEIGLTCYNEADRLIAAQRGHGVKSAEVRRSMHGTAQPHKVEAPSKPPRSTFEGSLEGVVEGHSNQSSNLVIQESKNQETSNQESKEEDTAPGKPVTPAASRRKRLEPVRNNPPTLQQVIDYATERQASGGGHVDPSEFHDKNTRSGWTYGKGVPRDVIDWKGHYRTWDTTAKRPAQAQASNKKGYDDSDTTDHGPWPVKWADPEGMAEIIAAKDAKTRAQCAIDGTPFRSILGTISVPGQ